MPTADRKWTLVHSLGLFGGVAALAIIDSIRGIPFVAAYYLTLGVMVALAAVIGHGVNGSWRGIFIDDSNRISLSRFQLTLWTILLLSGIVTAAFGNLFRGLALFPENACSLADPLGFRISPNVWALMGIALTSGVGAVLVNQTNKARRQDSVVRNALPGEASWSDLFVATEGAKAVDLTRVQNFYFTVILVATYGVLLHQVFAAKHFVCSFPELSPGMLTLLGISHAGYLTAKAVPK
jgi:hypothetical protein